MNNQEIIELESKYTSGLYSKRPIAIVRGAGAHVWDADGNEYIDCVGGHGSANIGHSNPAVVRAVTEQLSRLMISPEIFYNDRRALLEQKLVAIAPPQAHINRIFLCNSGAEAVEGALKLARYSTGRPEVVAFTHAFHGRTLGALSATWEPKYRAPFKPLVPGFKHVPFNDLEHAAASIDENTAAVLLELVQGEGGVRPASPAFVEGLGRLCRERDVLLIVDEVQTGFGRTGKLFATEHFNLAPDFITVAKSIAGGLPMAAILIGDRVRPLEPPIHGTTFGGNPPACAGALAAIDFIVEQGLPARAAELGAFFLGRLRRIESPLICEVRGLGLLVGVELYVKVAPILQSLQQRGVLALPAGPNVIRLLPPLVVQRADLERVAERLEEVLALHEKTATH